MGDEYWVAFADGPAADVVAHTGPITLEEAVTWHGKRILGIAACSDCQKGHPVIAYWVACLDHEPTGAEIESHARQVLAQ